MRIAQVNYAVDPNIRDPDLWLERCPTLVRWASSLVDAGADAVLVAQRFGRDAEFERDGVQYVFRAEHGLRSRWPAACANLHAAVGTWGPHVAHVNGLIFPVRTFRLRRALPPDTAIVLQDHGGVSRPRTSWRAGLRAADAVFFTALPQAAIWRLQSGDPLIFEIPEAGCDLESIPQAVARERSGVRGRPAVVCVGRLNETKDPVTVLEGFRLAAADLPDARLTFIYSSDELLSELRRRVEATGSLRTRVTFRGEVPHGLMVEYLSAADLFVLGSRREGSGYALMEALACGNVPVVTDIPSFRAITLDGSLGVLWRPGYPRACAAALLDAVQRDLTGARASIRERFMAEYGWKAVGEKALAAYREAIAARGASASRLLSASA
ncbi:MAG: glycosyltransferase family 4 protein [Acidobacteria bacterium]|nr:glycosyltransferase family 4 protein [Acidobacteriota bacterium]